MKSVLLMSLGIVFLVGCSPSNTPQAAGTHNLSKGDCIDVPCGGDECQTELADEEMTQTNCEMVGGQFVPKERGKSFWF